MTLHLQGELAKKADPLIKENSTRGRDCCGRAYAGHPFTHFSPDTSIVTDASERCWRAVCEGRCTGGRWSKQEATCHINPAPRYGQHNAVAYLRRRDGTTSVELSQVAERVWSWCLDKNTRIPATHRPGRENQEAYSGSRVFSREVREGRRFRAQLVEDLRIGLSAVQPYWTSSPEGSQRRCNADSHHSFVEKSDLVFSASETRRKTTGLAEMQRATAPVQCSRAGTPSASTEELHVAGLEDLARSWATARCSHRTVDTILTSWAPNTRRQYASPLNNGTSTSHR
ncbi:hypothetical protein COOONC_27291 [Cooperia oncophora]